MEHLILNVTAKFHCFIHKILGKEICRITATASIMGKKIVLSTDSVMFGKIHVTLLNYVETFSSQIFVPVCIFTPPPTK
jgi:hypothetical protein